MQEVGGSIPPGSTSLRSLRELRLGKPHLPCVAKRAKAAAPKFRRNEGGPKNTTSSKTTMARFASYGSASRTCLA
jgi:hypothetical protein